MTKLVTPIAFRKQMYTKCQACSSTRGEADGACPDRTCGWYPFRFGEPHTQSLDRRMKESLLAFDFDEEWAKVKPVLDDPLAIESLDAGMTVWCEGNNKEWNPNKGPWAYSHLYERHFEAAVLKYNESERPGELDQWCELQGCPDWETEPEANEEWYDAHWEEINEKENELMEDFYPQPATPDWYRSEGVCHWLAPWNCAIGELLYPDLVWHVVTAEEHSTAIGMDDSTAICMDILWGRNGASKIWDAVREGEWMPLQETVLFGIPQPEPPEVISPSAPSPLCESVLSDVSGVSQLSLAQ